MNNNFGFDFDKAFRTGFRIAMGVIVVAGIGGLCILSAMVYLILELAK
mgnify:CR=1 FL=1